MKLGKIIGGTAVGALLLSVIPYQVRKDKETGAVEVRSLLWGIKKTPGGENDRYTFTIPGSGLNEEAEKEAEAPSEECE